MSARTRSASGSTRPGDRTDHDGARRSSPARHEPRPHAPHRRRLDRRSDRSPARRTSSTLDRGRRLGNRADYQDLIRLSPDAQRRPLLRRLSGRAGRHPPFGPPPRRDPRPADADRQADPRLFARPPAEPRRDRDGPHRARHRRGDARARAVGLHGHQLQLAAAARHADAAGDHRVRRRATRSIVHDAVHARRGDGAGDARRRARRAERRGAGRHRPDPGRAARRAGRLWRLHLQRRHAVRRARPSARPSTCGPR